MNYMQRYLAEKDALYITGLGLIIVACIVFCVTQQSGDFFSAVFLGNFIMAAGYFLVIAISGRLKRGNNGLPLLLNCFVLALISCYTLNKSMTVFDESVTWFSVLLVLVTVNLLFFAFFERLPNIVKAVMLFIAGLGWAVYLYLALYLVPFYAIGLVVVLFLGISLHVFVPMLLSIYSVKLVNRCNNVFNKSKHYFFAGFTAVLLVVVGYVIAWGLEVHRVRQVVKYNGELPSWLMIAQNVDDGFLSEKILKSGLTYTATKDHWNDFLWRTPERGNWGSREHDPLALIGCFFAGNLRLDLNDQTRILKTVFSEHHQDERRLWAGRDLLTRDIQTNIMIWPDMRMAYTEMLLEVCNTKPVAAWPQQQEAIYSFYLQEGSVVTSLSLWIDGKEQKAVLTTKSKAAKAYNNIVGVQFRDPSVVHWQEGNRVAVRVFPVLNNDCRRFKIGITSPLRFTDHRLYYQPVAFEGPEAGNAKRLTRMDFSQVPAGLQLPGSFNKKGSGYEDQVLSNEKWAVSFDAGILSNASFVFKDTAYQLKPAIISMEPSVIQAVFLDINASWTMREYNEVCNILQHKQVFVTNRNNEIVPITSSNKEDLFRDLSSRRFSLFPFHKIPYPAAAMVIVKSGSRGPVLQDIKESVFYDELRSFFAKDEHIKVFNLNSDRSLYLSILKECRALQFTSGNLNQLQNIVSTQSFPTNRETPDAVWVDAAKICINKMPAVNESAAPDHFMRLYAYNNIFKNRGTALLLGEDPDPSVIAEAEEANIVTPVSSLVVLETQKDYDEFDIKKSKDGLDNAALQSKGAVPEPHEWLIIGLALMLLLYVRYQSSVDEKLAIWKRR